MYRLLTGRLPYEASTHASLAYAILNAQPVSPSRLRPDLPPLLDRIVMKAIVKDRGQRYRSWFDFGKDLSQAFTTLRLVGESASDSEKFNDLRNMPFFADLGDVALWEVVRIGSWKKIPAGHRDHPRGRPGRQLLPPDRRRGRDHRLGEAGGHHQAGRLLRRDPLLHQQRRAAHHHHHRAREVTIIEIKAYALRAATDACQVGFNKAFMRVLIERLAHANRVLAER